MLEMSAGACLLKEEAALNSGYLKGSGTKSKVFIAECSSCYYIYHFKNSKSGSLTESQDQLAFGRCGDHIRSQEVVEQHFQAQQLYGGDGGGRGLHAGVQVQSRRIRRHVIECRWGCWDKKTGNV